MSQAKAEEILAGGRPDTGDLSLVGASAVRSQDHEDAYYVAVAFEAEGVGEQTGVWAANTLEAGEGVVMSVNGIATEFTDFVDASTTEAAMSAADQGVKDASSCVS